MIGFLSIKYFFIVNNSDIKYLLLEEFMKKLVIFLCLILMITGGIFVFKKIMPLTKKEETPNYSEIYEVGDLPLTVDQVPLSYNVVDVEGKKMLKVSYRNNSEEAISGFTVNLKLKEDGEPVQVKLVELVNPENESQSMDIEVPQDFNIENIKPLKYMISLKKGVYMEYDSETNQYNWS